MQLESSREIGQATAGRFAGINVRYEVSQPSATLKPHAQRAILFLNPSANRANGARHDATLDTFRPSATL